MAKTMVNKHEWKWGGINMQLHRIGYSVIWERMIDQDQCRYAIRKGKYASKELLGIYNDEAEAEAMCKLLLSQAKYEEK